MEFRVYNVGHGFCASVTAGNGNVLLFDCGHTEGNRPSEFLPRRGWNGIEYFFITNYDEDHVSDFPSLNRALPIDWVYRNPSIPPSELRSLKLRGGPLSPAMASVLQMLEGLGEGSGNRPPTPGVEFRTYFNRYPGFSDTNNLSLVAAVDIGTLRVLIPGDLERAGWLSLLKRSDFQAELRGVDLFVASHHGRESGYCEDVFRFCSPSLIIMSDSEIVHASQKMANTFHSHASGDSFAGEIRHVVTTRRDGEMFWVA